MGYEAFVSLAMGFCGHKMKLDTSSEEIIIKLRCCVIGRIHITEQRKLLKTPSPKRQCTSSVSQTTPRSNSQKSAQTSPICPKQVSTHMSTSELIKRENLKQLSQQQHITGGGRRRLFKSRHLAKRCNAQEASNKQSAESIHYERLKLYGIARSASNSGTPNSSKWDEKLSVEDIVEIAKHAHSPKSKRTAYDLMTTDHAMKRFHYILNVQDNMNSTEFASDLRRNIPGLLDSGYSVDQLKKLQKKEFATVLQPQRTATGWRINPDRLHQCLKYVYPWIPEQEYWRIYGDARTYGKQKSVLLAIGNLNNEQLLNNIQIQSPKEIWPLSIFYFADSRLNLELNLANDGTVGYGPGWLNQ